MTPFDPRAYEAAVVKPLRRWSGGKLPDDVVSRYAIDLSMSDEQVVQRLTQVRSHWIKSATSTGKGESVKNVYKAFLRADEELLKTDGTAMRRIQWWRDRDKARASARHGEIAELAQTLRASFGDLGLVAAGQLEATRLAVAPTLSPEEVAQALRTAGVCQDTPIELPRSSGLPGTQYRALRSALVNAGLASVVELLHGGPVESFHILESFRSAPRLAGGLSEAAVIAARDRANRRSGNAAAREAIGILATAARTGVNLRQLTLFHLLDTVRDNHAQGVPPAAMLRHLQEAKLDAAEARLAVFSVRNESAGQRVGGLGAIKALIEEGRLVAARQALATVTGAEDAAAAKELVERQTQEVRRLREAAYAQLRADSEQDALHLLRQAAALAVDDEDLAAEVRRIPPPPVLGLTAITEGVGVRVTWRAAPTHDGNTCYRLMRQRGRAPVDPGDGAVVAAGSATVAVDTAVPAGQLIGYAVFAALEGDNWSRPASTTVEVLPPVHDVQLGEADGVVEGHWQVNPEAAAVEVRRGEVLVLSGSRTMFRDPGAAADHNHTYLIVARYRRPDGTMASSAPVVAKTTRRGRLVPVSMLRLAARSGHGVPMVAITWRQPAIPASIIGSAGSADITDITVRRAETPFPWEFGAVVPLDRLVSHGMEVAGRIEDKGEWRTLVASAPTGLHYYAAFTIGEAGAVRGEEVAFGLAPPVTELAYQRLGDEVVLSWQWPEAVGTAEVVWDGPAGSGRRQLTRQQYRSGGGCPIECGPGELAVKVRTVVHATGGTCTSPDAELTITGRRPTVSYAVQLARRPVVGGGTVRVRLTADQPLPDCTVLIVATHGPVMPRSAADGQLVLRSAQRIDPQAPVELVATLPRLRKPYWVRCFLEGSAAQLVDPPTTQLKVS
jgi:hypothetical protein